MKFYLTTLLALLTVCFTLSAQDIPIEIEATEVLFCQPGVTNASPSRGLVLEYGYRPSTTFGGLFDPNTGEAGDKNITQENWQDLILKVKAPLVNKTDLKVIIGMNHTEETYNFNPADISDQPFFQSLDGTKLKSTRFSAYLVKSLDSRFYGLARLEIGYNGDYEKFVKFDDRYAMYRAAAMVGRKWSEDLEFGAGVLYTKTFRRTSVWPFAFMNYTLSPKWGIEAVIPVDMKVRYDINETRLLLMGLDYNSREHSVDFMLADDGNPMNVFFRRHSIAPTVTFQQRLFSEWTWFDISTGYHFGLNSRVRNDDLGVDLSMPVGSGPFARISFFVSPPRKVICK